MNIADIVTGSFRDATAALVMGTSAATLARARERALLKALAARLRAARPAADLRVFAADGRAGAPAISGAQLYDISICRVESGSSAGRQPQEFHFIREALWQIELDFSREWRGALRAVSRLNCGAAAGKLLIACPPPNRGSDFRQTLAPPFAGSGERYLACIPHPSDWDDSEASPQVWRLEAGAWLDTIGAGGAE